MIDRIHIVDLYLEAKFYLLASGFATEIDWQQSLSISSLSEKEFLREAAWVILNSGMRESVVRQKFSHVSTSFFYWEDAEKISRAAETCFSGATRVFNHPGKISAIIKIAQRVAEDGFPTMRSAISSFGTSFLCDLPYIGPTTALHLAKNIGLDVVKPDRHLVRLALATGYKNPLELCEAIASIVGDRLSVIDLVLWRISTQDPGHFMLRL